MKANQKYKDSVFSALFNDPDVLRELYSAIEGITIPPDTPISINTLSNVLIKGLVNDVSFTIDNRLVVLIEHQSTISENLPLRLLEYIGRVYELIIDYEKRFQRTLIKLPKPEFIVLYNGKDPFPDYRELKLSDAFMDIQGLKRIEPDKLPLELIVHVFNIKQGHNTEMLKKSEVLDGYSILTGKIWEYRSSKKSLEESIELAVEYCLGKGILVDFIKKHSSEIHSMLYGEYRIEDEIAVVKRETREETWEECSKHEKQTIARNLLAEGSTLEFTQKITGLDLKTIKELSSAS
ncbi:MAG: Rpn family recombination-promoting nuclease/putative transposase [Treponema sp.]|nr:Rpn family recombination-promoting nuclease/putative transposase [Treponema sp.]